MPPGVNRTPCSLSHATAAARSSTHRPMWFSARLVDLAARPRVDRLHQIDLDAGDRQDVLVDVLVLAAEACRRRRGRAGRPTGGAARPCSARRSRSAAGRGCGTAGGSRVICARSATSSSVRSPGRGALTRIAMLPDGCWLSRISWWHSPVSPNVNTLRQARIDLARDRPAR